MPRWVWPHFPASRYGAARLVQRQGARDFVLRGSAGSRRNRYRAPDGPAPSDLEDRGLWNRWPLLFAARVATGGLIYLFAVLLPWRVAELLRPGTGPIVAVSFGLGTLAFSFAATVFGHLAAAVLAFSAWVVSWRRSSREAFWGVAGFLAALAVFFEYQAAIAAIIVLAYLIVRTRRARVPCFCFSPELYPLASRSVLTTASRSARRFTSRTATSTFRRRRRGFFGISAPTWAGLDAVLFGVHGIVREQPILVVAAVGLVLLWRRGLRTEAAACGATAPDARGRFRVDWARGRPRGRRSSRRCTRLLREAPPSAA
jgi:hypothetical protein